MDSAISLLGCYLYLFSNKCPSRFPAIGKLYRIFFYPARCVNGQESLDSIKSTTVYNDLIMFFIIDIE